jgi:hypothetical protein
MSWVPPKMWEKLPRIGEQSFEVRREFLVDTNHGVINHLGGAIAAEEKKILWIRKNRLDLRMKQMNV